MDLLFGDAGNETTPSLVLARGSRWCWWCRWGQTRANAGVSSPRRQFQRCTLVVMGEIVQAVGGDVNAVGGRRRNARYPFGLMRLSRSFVPTLRDDPAEAEIASHRLLLRAGFVRQLAAGIYSYLPNAIRVMRTIEDLVREEMEAAGSIEVRVPIVLPSEPWKATGRWEAYGDLVFKIQDLHARELMLGPTHEEVFAPLVAGDLPSYRDLPINLFQVEWKYRDERRPRFGLLRTREFLMKDAYSFDRDEDGMRESYRIMYEAYERIFERIGLDSSSSKPIPARSGATSTTNSWRWPQVGEDLFVRCVNGDYLADTEAATPQAARAARRAQRWSRWWRSTRPAPPRSRLVATQLGIEPSRTLKNIMFDIDGQAVAVLVPGDREVSEDKLSRLHFPKVVRPFDDADFARLGVREGLRGTAGFGEDVVVFADPAVRAGANWVTGANRADVHVTGANLDRDFRVDRWEDLIQIREGDRCPDRRRRARDRSFDRGGSHLPAGHPVFGAARHHVPG